MIIAIGKEIEDYGLVEPTAEDYDGWIFRRTNQPPIYWFKERPQKPYDLICIGFNKLIVKERNNKNKSNLGDLT